MSPREKFVSVYDILVASVDMCYAEISHKVGEQVLLALGGQIPGMMLIILLWQVPIIKHFTPNVDSTNFAVKLGFSFSFCETVS